MHLGEKTKPGKWFGASKLMFLEREKKHYDSQRKENFMFKFCPDTIDPDNLWLG